LTCPVHGLIWLFTASRRSRKNARSPCPLSKVIFEAYWRHDQDISQADVLRQLFKQLGWDDNVLMERLQDDAVKAQLRACLLRSAL
jgi:predicted DsbA family dithiol-disulfide isomerase